MQRRKFIRAGAAGAVALAGSQLAASPTARPVAGKEVIEWRTYDMAWGGNQGALLDYLTNVLQAGLRQHGATQFKLFKEYGMTDPAKIHVMISYPDGNSFVAGQSLRKDAAFASAAGSYDAAPADKPIFERYSSWVLDAFDGMPQSATPDENAGLFELRVYQGYSEDATRRKVRMFNDHEIEIFKDTDLDAVFYGDMIAGPYRPCLVYLLQFEDMAERDANWGKFGAHPEWNRINKLPEFADSVSKILRTFLVPVRQ